MSWAERLRSLGIHTSRNDVRRDLLMSNGQIHLAPPARSLLGVRILGSGSYVPERVVSNQDLRDSHGFDPDWIVNRTGIHERRFALPHQATSDLCTQAAIRCLKAARRDPGDVDLLVVATFTPDMAFPATANLIQDRLKLACAGLRRPGGLRGFRLCAGDRGAVRGHRQQPMRAGHRRRLQQPGHQSRGPEELSAVRRRCRRGPAGARRARPRTGGLPARLGRLGRRFLEPARLRQPDSAVRRGTREGPSLPDHGWPRRLQVGRPHPGRFGPQPSWPTPSAR